MACDLSSLLNLFFRLCVFYFFFSSRRRHTRCLSDWSSDVCSSDLRLEQQVAVDRVLDGVLQPADVHLAGVNLLFQGGNIGRTLRRLGRRRLLQLLKIGRASCRERV